MELFYGQFLHHAATLRNRGCVRVVQTDFQITFWRVSRVIEVVINLKKGSQKMKYGEPLPTIYIFCAPFCLVLRPLMTLLIPWKALWNRFGQTSLRGGAPEDTILRSWASITTRGLAASVVWAVCSRVARKNATCPKPYSVISQIPFCG